MPDEVKRYLTLACYPYPTEPAQLDDYPRCGFRFVDDGD